MSKSTTLPRPIRSQSAHRGLLLFALGWSLFGCKNAAKIEAHTLEETVSAEPNRGAPDFKGSEGHGPSALLAAPADALGYMKVVHDAALKEESTSAICKEDLSSGFGWTQFFDGDHLVRARVSFAANRGHDVWEYHFYYRDGKPLVLRQRVTDWRRTDQMATSDVVVEQTYLVEGEQARECLRAKVATFSDQKDQALENTPRSVMACSEAPRLLRMARAAQGPIGDVAWLKGQCEVQDPSADILAEIRRERAAASE